MSRLLVSLLVASAIGVSLAACNDRASVSASGWGPAGGTPVCSQYTSCGTCTPVSGCGWCFDRNGGACAPDPDSCPISSEFTWTWDPPGCPGSIDASVVPLVDAGASVGIDAAMTSGGDGAPPEAAPAEAAVDAAPEAAPADAATE